MPRRLLWMSLGLVLLTAACGRGSGSATDAAATDTGVGREGAAGDDGAARDATPAADGLPPGDAGTGGDGPAAGDGPTAGSYATAFPGTENPIAEGGAWVNGQAQGIVWRDVRTTPGLAFGTQPGTGAPPYDDSTALLTGTWSPDHTAQATVRVVNPSAVGQREVELRLRSTVTANSNRGYEVLCNVNTSPSYGIQIVRWNGPLNSYTYLDNTPALNCVDGDVLKASIAGNPPTITVWLNGQLTLQAADPNPNPFATGNPGIGFWCEGATGSEYGFSAFSATDGS